MSDYTEYSINWVDEVIEHEGIGYGLTSYFNLSKITDPELRRRCLEAEAAIKYVKKYLSKNSTRN